MGWHCGQSSENPHRTAGGVWVYVIRQKMELATFLIYEARGLRAGSVKIFIETLHDIMWISRLSEFRSERSAKGLRKGDHFAKYLSDMGSVCESRLWTASFSCGTTTIRWGWWTFDRICCFVSFDSDFGCFWSSRATKCSFDGNADSVVADFTERYCWCPCKPRLRSLGEIGLIWVQRNDEFWTVSQAQSDGIVTVITVANSGDRRQWYCISQW